MKLKILHLSAANSHTGAGIACLNIHNELLNQGILSKVLFLKNNGYEAVGVYYFDMSPLKKLVQKVITFLDRTLLSIYWGKKPILFSPNLFGVNLLSHHLVVEADIIHFHWINHGFVGTRSFKKFGKPVVFTMHDSWLFTGGCHHFFSCRRFENSCGNCTILNSSKSNDLSSIVLKQKKAVFDEANFQVVAISNWMKYAAQKSSILNGREIKVIPSAIDVETFYFRDRNICRKDFDIPLTAMVVLIGAQELDSPYKGIREALVVLENYTKQSLLILTFGNGEIRINNSLHSVRNLGFISSKDQMASLYASSNLFFAPSLAEGFGMSVAEAQACGTPVLAYQNTGPEDIIQHEVSGYLALHGNTADLQVGLEYCLHTKFANQKISEDVCSKFSIENSAEEYKAIYTNLIA